MLHCPTIVIRTRYNDSLVERNHPISELVANHISARISYNIIVLWIKLGLLRPYLITMSVCTLIIIVVGMYI